MEPSLGVASKKIPSYSLNRQNMSILVNFENNITFGIFLCFKKNSSFRLNWHNPSPIMGFYGFKPSMFSPKLQQA
jgi:hypothetical protein